METENLRRKFLITITITIIVFLALLFALFLASKGGFGSEQYQKVADNDRKEFIADVKEKLNNLEGMATYKYTYNYETVENFDGGGPGINSMTTIYVDGDKYRVHIIEKTSSNGEVDEYNATVWVDNKTEDIFFRLVIDDEIQEGRFGNDNYDISVTCIHKAFTSYNNIGYILRDFTSFLEDNGVELYSAENKVKITRNSASVNLEASLIFNSNNTYNCKINYALIVYGSEVGSYTMEIAPSTEKVTMPNY